MKIIVTMMGDVMWYSKQIQLPIWQKHAHKCNLCFTLNYIFVDFYWNITHTLCSLAGLVVFLEGWVLTGLSTSFSCILSRPPWGGNEIGGGNDVSLVAELSVPLIVLRPSTALQNPKKINFEHHLILQNIQISWLIYTVYLLGRRKSGQVSELLPYGTCYEEKTQLQTVWSKRDFMVSLLC